MHKVFSNKLVESSNIEKYNSLKEDKNVIKLNKDSLNKSLKNIPHFSRKKLKSLTVENDKLNGNALNYKYKH